MSVLKSKRSTSKAEYVNLANEIYTETVAFLTRLSARYARLLAEPVAALAGEIIDQTEKANSIFPKGEPNLGLRKGHLLEARAALMALDVRLGHCYTILAMNPQGCFTKTDGRSIPAAEATKKLDDMAQNLGEKIDRENELIKAVLESDRKRKQVIFGCISENVPSGRAADPLTAANAWCRSVNATNTNNFCLVNTNGNPNNNNANNSWAVAPGFHNPARGTGQMQ